MVGLVLVIAFTAAGCFCVFLRYEIIGTGYLPRGAICLLLLIVLANVILRRVARVRRWALDQREVLLVFLLLMVMAAIPGQEFAQHVYLNSLGIVHYTMPEIAPPRLYLDELNPLLVPSKDPDDPVIRWAYEGLPPGGAVPYGAWVRPLLIWTPFWFALYWVTVCFAAILGPRWEDEERVLYPLVQVPVEVAGRGSPRQPGVRRLLGVAPQALAIYEALSPEENLRFFGRVQGLSGRALAERVDWALAFSALEDRRRDRAGGLSGGMKRRGISRRWAMASLPLKSATR
jgi:hypothetical protein